MKPAFNIQLKSIIWKEFLEFVKTGILYAVVTIAFTNVMQIMVTKQLLTDKNLVLESKQVLAGFSILYISLLVIPFFGSTMLSRCIYEERKDTAMHILLATGIDPKVVWLGKMITTYILSYLVFISSCVVYVILLKLVFNFTITLSVENIVLSFVITPVLGYGIMSLLGYVYWSFKNPQIVGMIFPIVFLMGVWNFAMKFYSVNPSSRVIILITMVSALLIIFSYYAVSKTSNDKITNI